MVKKRFRKIFVTTYLVVEYGFFNNRNVKVNFRKMIKM